MKLIFATLVLVGLAALGVSAVQTKPSQANGLKSDVPACLLTGTC